MKNNILLASVSAIALSFASQAALAASNDVFINQAGVNASANINQTGNGNSVGNVGQSFSQSGTNNVLTVDQVSSSADGEGTGETVAAGPNAPYNWGFQLGANNAAYVHQGQNTGGGDTGDLANIYQDGTFNVLSITQDTGSETASVWQTAGSSFNSAVIVQNSFNDADADPDGNNNAFIQQSGSFGQAFISQTADDASATITQSGAFDTATILQGDEAIATITQSGTSDVASIDQTIGENNQAYVVQTGNFDLTNVTQTGFSEYASVSQSGNNQQAFVNQSGFLDNATINQSGSFNVASVLQDGTSDVSNVTQSGSFGHVTVTQH